MRRNKKEVAVINYVGRDINVFNNDGVVYFKANDMADSNTIKHWKINPSTLRYVNAIENKLGENQLVSNKNSMLNEIKGSKAIISIEGRNGGTWIHEKLVLSLARYISVEFEMWCDEQLQTLFREGRVEIKPKSKLDMLSELFPTSDKGLLQLTANTIEQREKLELENKALESTNKELTTENKQLTGVVSRDEYIGMISGFVKKIAKIHNYADSDAWTVLYRCVPKINGVYINTYYTNYKVLNKTEIKASGIKLTNLNSGINCIKYLATDEEIYQLYIEAKRIAQC